MSEPAAVAPPPAGFSRRLRTGVTSPLGVIATSAGVGSFATQFWMPFLPFFFLRIGATSDAGALRWLAFALTGQGIGRILTGPIWGMLADRYGRKVMYVRALHAATLTTIVAGLAQAPWVVVVSFTLQGALSGFIPAGVALASVSVPHGRLGTALATVTAAQYLGTTVGPALGAVFAALFGLRGAILVGAILPSLAAFAATLYVPRDPIAPRQELPETARRGGRRRLAALSRHLSIQLAVALFLYLILYSANGVLRVATPIAVKLILHGAPVYSSVGFAYTAAGLGSVVGALGLARAVIRPPRLRLSLTAVLVATAAAHVLLALSGSVVLFTLWFALISLAQGAMIPAANMLIASSVSRDWRGTAFGIASGFQALAFMLGPLSAAVFAAFSLSRGFMLVGFVLLLTAAVMLVALKEPELDEPIIRSQEAAARG